MQNFQGDYLQFLSAAVCRKYVFALSCWLQWPLRSVSICLIFLNCSALRKLF